MFDSIIGNSITIENFILCLSLSFVLGLIVSFVHKYTNKTNKNFQTSLAILPPLVTMVRLLVNGNLGTSVAVLGAFSLIRFRSIPGNSKEIINIFYAMVIGLAMGTGYIGYAIIFTLFIAFISLILHFISKDNKEKILKIVIPEDLDWSDTFNDIFDKYLKNNELINAKTINMGGLFELTYQVVIKDNVNEKELIDKIRVRNGNLKVSLSHQLIGGEL